jgi:phosphohistidine phosphatase
MKILYICRHAKSSWDYPELHDFERPLNNRGKRDAPLMGKILYEKNINVDKIISSPAKRAYKTAKIIAKYIGFNITAIQKDEKIYSASAGELIAIIQKVPDSVSSLMIFGHNPAFTSLNNYLSDISLDNIPTSGIVCLKFDISSWKEIDPQRSKQIFFEYPKLHLKKKR